MKLQISFDISDLPRAVDIAKQVAPYADIIEVGNLMLLTHGVRAIEEFRNVIGDTSLLADAKIVDRGDDCSETIIKAGADWITVMAGTSPAVINMVCETTQRYGKEVMLDLLDAQSPHQSALNAENLGVDALLYHRAHDDSDVTPFFDQWNLVRENTKLPIFISSEINRENLDKIIQLNPNGIIVGTSIVSATDPVAEAEFYRNICDRTS